MPETPTLPFVLKLASGVVLAALVLGAGAVATDLAFNEGRLVGILTGRNGLEASCLPELQKALTERGFSPAEIELTLRPGGADGVWGRRSLAAGFTFQDGALATRIDGVMACVVVGAKVRIEVRTSSGPLRAT